MAQGPVEVKVKGIKQLQAGSRHLLENIETATDRDAIDTTTDQTAASVRARVPVKSGRLRRSVHAVDARRGRGQVTMGAGLPYARFIEFGAWGGRRKGPRYVWPIAKRTARAFHKHCTGVTSAQIRKMRWQRPM